jgi:acetylornithine deacetylase/succinyl-diaminopimelate desuccinylase-like protein
MERDTIDLLKELVAIDSQNPSLVPGAAGESTIAGYVAGWAQAAGLAAEIVEATPGCCCAGTWTPWAPVGWRTRSPRFWTATGSTGGGLTT